MRILSPCRAALLALVVLALSGRASAQARLEITADEKTVMDLVNKERAKEGLAAFLANSKLFSAARGHARNMAAQKNMAHDLDGKGLPQRVRDVGFEYFGIGENIAKNATPAGAVDAWMKSAKGHRETILAPKYIHPLSGAKPSAFDEIGIGVADGADGQRYWCMVVGMSTAALENPAVVVSGKVSPPDIVVKKEEPKKKLDPKSEIPTPRTPAIARGKTVEGALSAKSPFNPKVNRFFEMYDLKLRKGENVVVDLEASFDTILIINDERGATLADNDDRAKGDLNSRITFTAPSDGTFHLIATSYGQRVTGAFKLSVK